MTLLSTQSRQLLGCAYTVAEFERWITENSDDLVRSASLLGGRAGKAAADVVVQASSTGTPIVQSLRPLRSLDRILSLETANDPFSDAAARLMQIHPDDPRADVARLCAEAVNKGLGAAIILARHAVQEKAA